LVKQVRAVIVNYGLAGEPEKEPEEPSTSTPEENPATEANNGD
jgi:hypothetical protein